MEQQAAAKQAQHTPGPSFDVRRDEMRLIDRIANRAVSMGAEMGVPYKKLDASMDITAVHANGNRLRLRELLESDDFNFGIRNCLNRETGKLKKFFRPRFSARVPA